MPHPPIAVAGISRGSSTFRWASQHDWMPMSLHCLNAADSRSHWAAYAEASEAAGHAPDRRRWAVCRDVYVADTDAQARSEVLESSMADAYRQYFFPLLRSVKQLNLFFDRDDMLEDDVTAEYLLATRWLVGSPETIARQLRELYAAICGYGELLKVCSDWDGRNGDRWRHLMDLLARRSCRTSPI